MTATYPRIEESRSRSSVRFRGEDDAWLESDGMASEVRRAVPLAARKELGQFFTPSDMVEKVWAPALPSLGPTSVIADPACGAGNLLIPAARFLREQYGAPVAANQLRGHDLNSDFVRGTRERLSALLGADLPEDSFTQNDYLSSGSPSVRGATHVIMNPPYVKVDRPVGAAWANRRVNAAAVFVITALREMAPGAMLLAILPDVLRSGSSYHGWREELGRLTSHIDVMRHGAFDAHTDVDVFSIQALASTRTSKSERLRSEWNAPSGATNGVIGDAFTVRVGSVVPHRTRPTDSAAPFLTARGIKPWTTVDDVEGQANVASRLDRGPFVVVRRTSSPRDGQRIRANLVTDRRGIGVENHLIVLTPTTGGVDACRDLMANLGDPRTNDYINDRIRCRHLTVDSVSGIPWWSHRSKVDVDGAH